MARVRGPPVSVIPSGMGARSAAGGRYSTGRASTSVPPRTELRSRPAKLGCSASWRAALGQHEICVTRSRSIRSSASPGSKRSWITAAAPETSAASSTMVSPPTQKKGMGE